MAPAHKMRSVHMYKKNKCIDYIHLNNVKIKIIV